MSEAVKQSRRRCERQTPLGNGELQFVGPGAQLHYKATMVDISDKGMGVVVGVPLPVGVRLRMFTMTHSFAIEVVWCETKLDERDEELRCGIRIVDTDENLLHAYSHLLQELPLK